MAALGGIAPTGEAVSFHVKGRVRLKDDGREGEIVDVLPETYWVQGRRQTRFWLIVQLENGNRVSAAPTQVELMGYR
jgi:hypothetical protein